MEQSVEAWHHRELGIEARENILNEIRDNKQQVDRARPAVTKNGSVVLFNQVAEQLSREFDRVLQGK